SCFDRGFRASGRLDALQVHRFGDFTRQDHTHVACDHRQHAGLLEHEDVDIADGQGVQVRQTDFSLERSVQRLEATPRQTALPRHLIAFETDFVETARTRLLTFVTTAGSLAQAGADTATDAALCV